MSFAVFDTAEDMSGYVSVIYLLLALPNGLVAVLALLAIFIEPVGIFLRAYFYVFIPLFTISLLTTYILLKCHYYIRTTFPANIILLQLMIIFLGFTFISIPSIFFHLYITSFLFLITAACLTFVLAAILPCVNILGWIPYLIMVTAMVLECIIAAAFINLEVEKGMNKDYLPWAGITTIIVTIFMYVRSIRIIGSETDIAADEYSLGIIYITTGRRWLICQKNKQYNV